MTRLQAVIERYFGRSRNVSRVQLNLAARRALQRLRQDPMWESDAPLFLSPVVSSPVASTFLGRRSSESEGGRWKSLARWVPLAAAAALVFIIVARPWSSDRLATVVADGVFELVDGSRVEARPETDLSFERADDGIRIRLGSGGIIVHAAKQRDGHLYVQTRDVTVTVVGTVFLVNAEDRGSRVAVIEGEVRVQQGTTEKKLRPGEQVATNPAMASPPIAEGLAWSRNAGALVGLLQQATAPAAIAPQNPLSARVAFELVSIRMRESKGGTAGARGQGAADEIAGGPCESRGPVQLDPRRLAITRAGLLWLITAAYGLGPLGESGNFDARCRNAVSMKVLSEGPDWVRTTEFDVEALLPPGIAAYTERQLERGEAPEIQRMLQAMLAERFKLVLKREGREMPIYILSVIAGGPKLTPAKERPESVERDGGVTPANLTASAWGMRRFPDCAQLRRMIEEGVDNENVNRCRRYHYGAGTGFGAVEGTRVSIDQFAAQLQRVTQRPVVNRTGIPGVFDIDLLFAPTLPSLAVPFARYAAEGRTILSTPSLFKALEDQMGLRLEAVQTPVETFIIEHVELPTPN
jgi:uncharacterized protein (TIGR03435 family)